jgi:hypothetical protein
MLVLMIEKFAKAVGGSLHLPVLEIDFRLDGGVNNLFTFLFPILSLNFPYPYVYKGVCGFVLALACYMQLMC